jgi:cohesin complex subunit SA-1/2
MVGAWSFVDVNILIGFTAAVFVNAEPIKEAAQEWLERYVQDNTAAMTELVNFMLKAAGCDVHVTADDINDFDNAAGRLRDIQDEYQSVSNFGSRER